LSSFAPYKRAISIQVALSGVLCFKARNPAEKQRNTTRIIPGGTMTMRSRLAPLYNLVDGDYYEKFDAYSPQTEDFFDRVSSALPSGWVIQRQGIWFHCGSPQNHVPLQGWKIHVSATPANAREVLGRVSSTLLQAADTNFKFALDLRTLLLINGKNWPRGGSGKFITVYPHDNRHFLDLIEQLHQVTAGFHGPYILSDHRYENSNVVFYRYGGMRVREVLNVKGERTPTLVGPDGIEVSDPRMPYPVTPPWEVSPFPPKNLPGGEQPQRIKDGRYQIEEALSFSSAGGVYRGTDHGSGKEVVIKEARPCIHSCDGYDAVETLRKEYRLLTLLQDTGISPRPVDLFQEWEHWFLVEEYIPGSSMAAHCSQHNALLRTRATREEYEAWYRMFRSICLGLARIVEVLHQHGVVFADLSTNNLLVLDGKTELKLIDFEGASEIGVDRPSTIYTPGFVSGNRLAGSTATFEDDYYSVGAVLLAYLFPVNSLFDLKPEAKTQIMACIQRDARLPKGVADMVLALMDHDPKQRLKPSRMIEVMANETELAAEAPERSAVADYKATLAGIVGHIEVASSYSRHDRLFPADPKVFATNPLSLAYGAAGVGYALAKIQRKQKPELLEWILRHPISSENYAPGLYLGMSGIALCLLEMGATEEAEQVVQRTFNHPLLDQAPDIFYGIAGWGLTNLHFFLNTGNELYLDKATEAGRKLIESRRLSAAGCYWESFGETRLGFAHGASGVALFLLYLYCATGDSEFLETGRLALKFDVSFGVETKDGGLSWRQSVSGPSPLFPYWRFGSAGIGAAVLRYSRLCGNDEYGSTLEKICIDADRRYAVFPGRFVGLAGVGEFMLDMYDFTGETRYFNAAARTAEGVLQFAVERPGGIAFPGDMLSRLCCDYGTGSAGIALFLNRLLGRQKPDFMLDCLLGHSVLIPGCEKVREQDLVGVGEMTV
jgi:serine/threonine protein kinase